MAKLNSVSAIQALEEDGVFALLINVTDLSGTRNQWFVSRPDDPFGLGPDVRAWLAANPNYPVSEYVPPTDQQRRERMPMLSRLAFRNKFKAAGMTTAVILSLINAIEDESLREDMQIAWEDTQNFGRLDPIVTVIAAGKPPAEIDAIWTA